MKYSDLGALMSGADSLLIGITSLIAAIKANKKDLCRKPRPRKYR